MSYTPGPWTAEVDSDGVNIGTWSGRMADPRDGGGPVVDKVLFRIDRKDRATLDDCYLIAAAPDLLAACEVAADELSYADDAGRIVEIVRAAIAKAKGITEEAVDG